MSAPAAAVAADADDINGMTVRELRAFIDRMSVDEQAELTAIMWIGRGSFEAEELSEALATARSEATTPTADYLIGTPHLADNIEAGLEASTVDLEALVGPDEELVGMEGGGRRGEIEG